MTRFFRNAAVAPAAAILPIALALIRVLPAAAQRPDLFTAVEEPPSSADVPDVFDEATLRGRVVTLDAARLAEARAGVSGVAGRATLRLNLFGRQCWATGGRYRVHALEERRLRLLAPSNRTSMRPRSTGRRGGAARAGRAARSRPRRRLTAPHGPTPSPTPSCPATSSAAASSPSTPTSTASTSSTGLRPRPCGRSPTRCSAAPRGPWSRPP